MAPRRAAKSWSRPEAAPISSTAAHLNTSATRISTPCSSPTSAAPATAPQGQRKRVRRLHRRPGQAKFLPFIWGPKHKTYFFHDEEYLRSLGGATRPWFRFLPCRTAPAISPTGTHRFTIRNRQTTSMNGVITKTPYPGNSIPGNQQSALAQQWMKFLPTPTSSGPVNNYLSTAGFRWHPVERQPFPLQDRPLLGRQRSLLSSTVWRQQTQPNEQCAFPVQLCTSSPANPEDAWVSRFNWDHIFTPTFLSHFAYGYVNRNEGYGSVTGQDPSELPQIPNAAAYNASPDRRLSAAMALPIIAGWGNSSGYGPSEQDHPAIAYRQRIADLGAWRAHDRVRRRIPASAAGFPVRTAQSGGLNFSAGSTGIPGVDSGNPFASLYDRGGG